jgi:5-methylcytosine-specific restriction protein B
MRVLYTKDEDAAIEAIRLARKTVNGIYDAANASVLGTPTVDEGDETQRRISPWFSQGGFGGYLITSANDSEGYRHLQADYISLLDGALASPSELPESAKTSVDDYLNFITQAEKLESATLVAGKELFDAIVSATERFGMRKIICVAGIPGTGKSHVARLAASAIVDHEPYRFAEIQFHPGTSYEDFVEGFMPKPSGEGFELQPKILRIMNRRARLDPNGARYVLFIEEFTRADVQAVMGELLTYIEHRDRPFHFAISNQEDRLAPNLVVITTMNPRDRSSIMLDQAVLRRLHRVNAPASVAELHRLLDGKLHAALLEQLERWFGDNITALPFGHAEFADVRSETDLRDIWTGTLEPFLLDVTGEVREVYKGLYETYPWK